MKAIVLVFCAVIGLAGCTATSADTSLTINTWIRANGGESRDAHLARVRGIGEALLAALPEGSLPAAPVRFHVLDNPGLTAYSWPSGDVYLSAGLMDVAGDDEIAAAIAHEMGHLINQAPGKTASGLRGAASPLDVEEQADSTGAHLLCVAGRPPTALASLLQKVCAACKSPQSRQEIQARIARLSQPKPDMR